MPAEWRGSLKRIENSMNSSQEGQLLKGGGGFAQQAYSAVIGGQLKKGNKGETSGTLYIWGGHVL